jgi:hypothetical protein
MKQKRGFSLIILVVILLVLVSFISERGSEKIKPEIFAKDLCLLTLEDKGTITIQTNFSVEKQQNGFLVKKKDSDLGFFYPCIGQFDAQKNGNILTLDIK